MKKLHIISNLIDIYGAILTKKQLNAITLFYFNDYSLAEIADIQKITRAAVYNNINKATRKLLYYENKLKIFEKKSLRELIYRDIKQLDIIKKLEKIDKGK
ncbi:MAG: sigma factor-like helix-turn-helix DNA-binding protein [Mycoplasmoidaceae bacterium]